MPCRGQLPTEGHDHRSQGIGKQLNAQEQMCETNNSEKMQTPPAGDKSIPPNAPGFGLTLLSRLFALHPTI